ncbi:hypothetical protein R1sor_005857 [Riccia sorocarpa]|uniref:Uncharacterized protein n=1 Tax=Riccia sorocarpa TaxID=122646 RepID=A0ABD3HMT8_9MARC
MCVFLLDDIKLLILSVVSFEIFLCFPSASDRSHLYSSASDVLKREDSAKGRFQSLSETDDNHVSSVTSSAPTFCPHCRTPGYEKELIGLAASNLSQIDILRRQRTSNKQLREVSITDQDYLDNVMQDVLGQLELKVMNVTGAHETYR